MTTREKLILMQDIKRKNDITWSRYAAQSRPGWTWEQPTRQKVRPFEGIGSQCILSICVPLLLVLFMLTH